MAYMAIKIIQVPDRTHPVTLSFLVVPKRFVQARPNSLHMTVIAGGTSMTHSRSEGSPPPSVT